MTDPLMKWLFTSGTQNTTYQLWRVHEMPIFLLTSQIALNTFNPQQSVLIQFYSKHWCIIKKKNAQIVFD